jgi:hypothetical protein
MSVASGREMLLIAPSHATPNQSGHPPAQDLDLERPQMMACQ